MVVLNLSSVMIGTKDPKGLSKFYKQVFQREADWQEEGWFGWQLGPVYLTIGMHSEVTGKAKEPQRVILNLETDEVEEEFERIKDEGATVVKEPYEMEGVWIATLADPEGNYFQLMSPGGEEWQN